MGARTGVEGGEPNSRWCATPDQPLERPQDRRRRPREGERHRRRLKARRREHTAGDLAKRASCGAGLGGSPPTYAKALRVLR